LRKGELIFKSLGMIPKYQFELPSNGSEKRFSLEAPAADEAWPSRLTLVHNNELLGVADSEFRRRGSYLIWAGFGGLVISGLFLFFVSFPFYMPLSFWTIPAFALITLPFAGAFLWVAGKELKRYIVYPVVFNRRTGNVHFFSIHDGQPVTYPWRQCIYCVVPKRNGGPEGSYYELRGYVLNKRHGGVMDSFSIGEEAINVGRSMGGFIERWFSCHYEYVRAFMTLDSIDGLDAPSEEDYISLKPSFERSMNMVQPKVESTSLIVRSLSLLMSIVTVIPEFLGGVGHYLCCKYCKVPQWSQEIIEECGPEIVLSNR